jgi:inosine/xanthosine triphosphate pyrophosphatase family protein
MRSAAGTKARLDRSEHVEVTAEGKRKAVHVSCIVWLDVVDGTQHILEFGRIEGELKRETLRELVSAAVA